MQDPNKRILYTHLNNVLNELNNLNEGHYDGAIDEVKMDNITDALTYYDTMKELYGCLDAARKMAYHHLDRLNKSILPAKFEDADMDKVQIASLGKSFYPLTKMSVSPIDKVAAYNWLRDNGAELHRYRFGT